MMTGLICAPTAFGKTAVAAWLIAEAEGEHVRSWSIGSSYSISGARGWRCSFEMPIDQIGQIGGGKTKRTETLMSPLFRVYIAIRR